MPHTITKNDIDRTKALAHIMTKKWEPGLVHFEDVLGDGLEGLVRTAQRYDDTKGKHFWAYASVSVRGYMLNGFRRRFGEKGQKLAMERSASLSIGPDESPDRLPLELSVEDNTEDSGIGLIDKINQLGLDPLQSKVMILLAAGYTQSDISRATGVPTNTVSRSVQGIRQRFSKQQLAAIIGA